MDKDHNHLIGKEQNNMKSFKHLHIIEIPHTINPQNPQNPQVMTY